MSAPTQFPVPAEVPSPFQFDPVEEAVAAIKNGEFVVVMDDEDRENEGDVICAASKITEEGMAWFIKWTRWVWLAGVGEAEPSASGARHPPGPVARYRRGRVGVHLQALLQRRRPTPCSWTLTR
jgi:3,4-dihydroxy 2-butanone 4-phosphate synthase